MEGKCGVEGWPIAEDSHADYRDRRGSKRLAEDASEGAFHHRGRANQALSDAWRATDSAERGDQMKRAEISALLSLGCAIEEWAATLRFVTDRTFDRKNTTSTDGTSS